MLALVAGIPLRWAQCLSKRDGRDKLGHDGVSRNARGSGPGGRELVLRSRLEVAGVVPLVQLIGGIAAQAVDLAAAPHRRALADHRRSALHILVVAHRQEFAAAILV